MNEKTDVDSMMTRTEMRFKRSENAVAKGKMVAKYARPLKKNAGGLAQFLLHFLDGIAPIISKSKMSRALRESSEDCGMEEVIKESLEPFVEELYENDEPEDDNDTVSVTGLTLRQLLEMGADGEVRSWVFLPKPTNRTIPKFLFLNDVVLEHHHDRSVPTSVKSHSTNPLRKSASWLMSAAKS